MIMDGVREGIESDGGKHGQAHHSALHVEGRLLLQPGHDQYANDAAAEAHTPDRDRREGGSLDKTQVDQSQLQGRGEPGEGRFEVGDRIELTRQGDGSERSRSR
jgi:hypothetical protein